MPLSSIPHALLETLTDPVLVLDRGWQVRAANAAARAILDAPGTGDPDAAGTRGEARPGLHDRSVLTVLTPRQAAVAERCLNEASATDRPARHAVRDPDAGTTHVTAITVAPQGDAFWVILHVAGAPAAPRAGGDGDGSEAAQTNADITQGLIEAGISLAAEQALDRLLQAVVDVARSLTSARYAALGIVNDAGTGLSDFITSGLTPTQRERIGDLPTGHGILGLLVRDARPIRLHDLSEHPVSVGMPAHHPPMRGFMGVPVVTRGRVFGNLYLTEKVGGGDFTDADLTLAQTFAAQAAVAIDNAQLRRERDRFFAAASHELGNAIAGVTLWARLLSRQPPETHEQWRLGVRNILGAAEQTSRLVEDLLSLSRMREGRLALDAREAAIAALAAEALEQLRPEAEAARVTLALARGATTRVVVSDCTRVRQILLNLIGNAVKFSPAGGTVTVSVLDDDGDDDAGRAPGGATRAADATETGDVSEPTRPGHGIVAYVRDDGPGVPASHRERIFQPYEQIASVARGRGAGLGLHLSRQLARLLGGDLWVEDAEGGGARFALRLPAVLPGELPYDKR
jgi:signal transduction histidine kinase